jgi:hypothetical protein
MTILADSAEVAPEVVPEGDDIPDSAALMAALFPDGLEEEVSDEETAPVDVEEPVVEPDVVPPAPVVEPEDPAPGADPAFDRLVKREKAAREREQALRTQEQAIEAREVAIKQAEAFKTRLKDPYAVVAMLKEAGADLAALAKAAWSEDLGEAAPADHKAAKRERTIKDELDELRALVTQRDKAHEEALKAERIKAQEAQYVAELNKFATTTDDAPLVRAYIESNPTAAQEKLYRVADNIAKVRISKQNYEVPTYQEVCAALNTALSEYETVFKPRTPAPATKPATPASKPAPTSRIPTKDSASRKPVPDDDIEALRAQAREALYQE